jgi:hypothetical protein
LIRLTKVQNSFKRLLLRVLIIFCSIDKHGTGVRPKVGSAFDDLLGSQGYSFTSTKDSGPRTMNAMRKEEIARDMDPEKLKVCFQCRIIYSIIMTNVRFYFVVKITGARVV